MQNGKERGAVRDRAAEPCGYWGEASRSRKPSELTNPTPCTFPRGNRPRVGLLQTLGTVRSWQPRMERPDAGRWQQEPCFRPTPSRTGWHVAAYLSVGRDFAKAQLRTDPLCSSKLPLVRRALGEPPTPLPAPGRVMTLLPQPPRKENAPLGTPLLARGSSLL